jgi:PAS domain-containing protein
LNPGILPFLNDAALTVGDCESAFAKRFPAEPPLSEFGTPKPFSFDLPPMAEFKLAPAGGQLQPEDALEGLERLKKVVEATGAAAYHWIIDNDEMVWSANVQEVLGVEPSQVATGRAFAALLDSENFTTRYDTVMGSGAMDDGGGVAFEIEYQFRPEGRTGLSCIWLEDHGKWFSRGEGRPSEVFGTVRRIDARHEPRPHDGSSRRSHVGGGARGFALRLRHRRHQQPVGGERGLWLRSRRRGHHQRRPQAAPGGSHRRRHCPLLRQQVRFDPQQLR